MSFLYRVRETASSAFVEIEGSTAQTEYLMIPGSIEGLPVCRIAGHAFEGRGDFREVYIPDTVKELGSFAFHNCGSLRRITMYDTVQDYAHGVLRHCAHLEEVILHSKGADFSLLKQVLEAHEESVAVVLHLPDGVVRLPFPDYTLIASENTMARTIQFAYEGGGYAYRQCVRKREIRYREYDSLFSFVAHDDPDYAAEVAADRLMYPRCLDGKAEKIYEAFLMEHDREALCRFVRAGDTEKVQWMVRRGIAGGAAVDDALRIASERKETQICAILIDTAADTGAGPGDPAAAGVPADPPVSTAAGTAADSSTGIPEGAAADPGENAGAAAEGKMRVCPGMLELEDW